MLHQHAVAGCFDDATAMSSDGEIDKTLPDRLKLRQHSSSRIVPRQSLGNPQIGRFSPILEVVMLDVADALPLAVERAEPPWRQAIERSSVQDLCDVSDKPEIGRDAFSPYNHRGTLVVASAWLVFYVIAAIHHFIAS
jgi:hypothetical protein